MNRRAFLEALLGGAIAAHTLDIEKLLWVPGKKTIFVPLPKTALPEVHWRLLNSGVSPIKFTTTRLADRYIDHWEWDPTTIRTDFASWRDSQ